MTDRICEFAYGRGTKTFAVPDEDVLAEVRTADFPVIENIPEAVLDAVRHPIGSPALEEIVKPGDTVAFICNDPTRVANSFDFMPVLVNELNRLGVPDANMKIVFALGTHREMTDEEIVAQVGADVAGRLKTYNSVSTRTEDFEYFGTTSRGTPVWINKELCNVDHVILTGTIVHHYFSGYGGGRKAILPGCAAMETVRVNHSFMLDEHAKLGVTDGNPCYEDQMEGVDLQRQIGDDLVGIHVRGRPRPALDAVHRELVEHVPGQDTVTGGANGDADIPGQYLQFHVGQGTGFFDAGQGPDHFRELGKRRSGDMEIVHGPQGLHAIVNRIIYGQFTQKIMLQPTHGTSCGYAEKDNA